MAIMEKLLAFSPLLGAAAGYPVDGVTGATTGFVIPTGSLIVMWLFGTR